MRASRASLGLPARRRCFLVPQSLFKLHPADDRRVARVLAAAPGSESSRSPDGIRSLTAAGARGSTRRSTSEA